MSLRERVLKELAVQESLAGLVENKPLILKILDTAKWESEFLTLCEVSCHRYGPLSYQIHRFYSIKKHLLPLFTT
jgi:hypothetical protein